MLVTDNFEIDVKGNGSIFVVSQNDVLLYHLIAYYVSITIVPILENFVRLNCIQRCLFWFNDDSFMLKGRLINLLKFKHA